MRKIYACLAGEWVCLNDDPKCAVGKNQVPPSQWWEEDAVIWAPSDRGREHTLYEFPFVMIHYGGKDYRIHPAFVQVVFEPDP